MQLSAALSSWPETQWSFLVKARHNGAIVFLDVERREGRGSDSIQSAADGAEQAENGTKLPVWPHECFISLTYSIQLARCVGLKPTVLRSDNIRVVYLWKREKRRCM